MAKSPVPPRTTTAKTTAARGRRTTPRAREVVPPRRSPLLIILTLASALVVLGIVALVLTRQNKPAAVATGEHQVLPYATDSTQGRQHITNVAGGTYNSNPPAGGDHYGQWATWGIQTVAPPDSMLVHNLEHGGVIFWYDSTKVDAATVEKMKTLTRDLQNTNFRVILTPRTSGIEGNKPIAATSWGYILTQDQYNEAGLRAFFNEHIAKGPECSAGQCPQ